MNFKLIWNIIKNLKQLGAYCLFTFTWICTLSLAKKTCTTKITQLRRSFSLPESYLVPRKADRSERSAWKSNKQVLICWHHAVSLWVYDPNCPLPLSNRGLLPHREPPGPRTIPALILSLNRGPAGQHSGGQDCWYISAHGVIHGLAKKSAKPTVSVRMRFPADPAHGSEVGGRSVPELNRLRLSSGVNWPLLPLDISRIKLTAEAELCWNQEIRWLHLSPWRSGSPGLHMCRKTWGSKREGALSHNRCCQSPIGFHARIHLGKKMHKYIRKNLGSSLEVGNEERWLARGNKNPGKLLPYKWFKSPLWDASQGWTPTLFPVCVFLLCFK